MEILEGQKNKITNIDILNALPAMVSYVGTDLRYSYANDAFLAFHETERTITKYGRDFKRVRFG